jgi:N-acetyltransferase
MLSSTSTAPSSPRRPDNAIFSDEPARASSPPSSPPGFPWEQQQSENAPKSPIPPSRNAFSLLGKRKALAPITENARPAKKSTTASAKPLTQMQISLGQEVQKRCDACGMTYTASAAEDRKLHDKYHKQNTEGCDVGKHFVQRARDRTVFKGAVANDSTCVVDCYDKYARKKRAQTALEVVQRELGAVPIPAEEIWDVKECEDSAELKPKYMAYMYIRGTKCVGYLLVERITEARRVLAPGGAVSQPPKSEKNRKMTALEALKARKQAEQAALALAESQPIKLSTATHPAKLGISRIWTSPSHRGQKIATTLLDTALMHHNQSAENGEEEEQRHKREHDAKQAQGKKEIPGLKVLMDEPMKPLERIEGKEEVAFSQPTDAGARLARKWFGKAWGWGVYVD